MSMQARTCCKAYCQLADCRLSDAPTPCKCTDYTGVATTLTAPGVRLGGTRGPSCLPTPEKYIGQSRTMSCSPNPRWQVRRAIRRIAGGIWAGARGRQRDRWIVGVFVINPTAHVEQARWDVPRFIKKQGNIRRESAGCGRSFAPRQRMACSAAAGISERHHVGQNTRRRARKILVPIPRARAEEYERARK